MGLIMVSLIVGILLGLSGITPSWLVKRMNKLTTVTLFVMLAALGAQIGSDRELLNNITVLGFRALVISVLSILGSVGLLWLVARYFQLAKQEGE